jgi:predicted dehydrogenase
MSTHALRLGIVGCGRLAESGYLPALAGRDAFTLVAVADPDAGRRARVVQVAASATRIDEFADAREMAVAAGLDAAVIASPVSVHVEDAHALAAVGVATLVEKPPAPDGEGARALAAITPAPWVGFNRRFDLGAQRLRDSIPRDVDLDLQVALHYRRASWRPHSVHDDALLDLGPHLVDWGTWVTRSAVVAVGDAVVEHDRASCTLTLTRGKARLFAECSRPHRELIDVRDASGARVARHAVGGLASGVRARVTRSPHLLVASLAAQLSEFATAVRGGPADSLATPEEAVAIMAALDAARVSAAEDGRTVSTTAAQGA